MSLDKPDCAEDFQRLLELEKFAYRQHLIACSNYERDLEARLTTAEQALAAMGAKIVDGVWTAAKCPICGRHFNSEFDEHDNGARSSCAKCSTEIVRLPILPQSTR